MSLATNSKCLKKNENFCNYYDTMESNLKQLLQTPLRSRAIEICFLKSAWCVVGVLIATFPLPIGQCWHIIFTSLLLLGTRTLVSLPGPQHLDGGDEASVELFLRVQQCPTSDVVGDFNSLPNMQITSIWRMQNHGTHKDITLTAHVVRSGTLSS